ncbi:MAG: hypothetical protein FWD36_10470 [Treponema sp.]|nr:hypothetical protein [Treponema sp.]
MNKTMLAIALGFTALCVHAQWHDGLLMDVQEVNITAMQSVKMSGAEAVMKVIEQYADGQYRFAFISNNYLLPAEHTKNITVGKNRLLIAVAGYPLLNDLIYTQVFFDQSFFFVALAKNESDMKRSNSMQIIRMNYEKRNALRRNNVRDTIQRNNIIPLGIDAAERY